MFRHNDGRPRHWNSRIVSERVSRSDVALKNRHLSRRERDVWKSERESGTETRSRSAHDGERGERRDDHGWRTEEADDLAIVGGGKSSDRIETFFNVDRSHHRRQMKCPCSDRPTAEGARPVHTLGTHTHTLHQTGFSSTSLDIIRTSFVVPLNSRSLALR